MKATAKAAANTAAIIVLTALVFSRIAWLPGFAALANMVIDTVAWQKLQLADAWLRLSLGATVGPESDEMMLVWCSLAASFAIAVALVWGANRAVHVASASRARAPRRIAGA